MQHLDEGTIHTWLDGALSPQEAAQAKAHVDSCPQCQAAVAEARGFIAASSRILMALDDAPRGVIPIAPKRRVQPWVWRVAATVLVVATGTVLLVKDRGNESRSETSSAVDSSAPSIGVAPPPPVTTLSQQTAAADSASAPRTTGKPVSSPAAIRPMSPGGIVAGVTPAPTRVTSKQNGSVNNVETRAPAYLGRVDAPTETKSDAVASAPAASANGATAARAPTALRQAFGVATGVAAEAMPREVGSRHSLGQTQTLYEIAPGDTVVLEEQSPVHLQSAVIEQATGAARRAQAQPTRPAEKTAAASAESQQKAEPASAPPPAPVVTALSDAQVGERHSISWLDPSTRAVMILSGRHSQAELERIREQIQQLRAERAKKNPD